MGYYLFSGWSSHDEFQEKMNLDEIGGADAAHALYDDELVEQVSRLYAGDIERYGYEDSFAQAD